MKQTLQNIIGFIGTSAFVFAFTFEGLTGLGANLEANRTLLEERVRLHSGISDAGIPRIKRPPQSAMIS